MDDERYQKLKKQELSEIANSIQLEASLAAMKAKNDDVLKEILQLEQELAAVTAENETLNRFKGFSQEQCFSAKAEYYKIKDEKQKGKKLLDGIDQSTSYWKNIFKRTDASTKSLDEHVTGLYNSPWIVQKLEAKADFGKMTEKLGELEHQLSEMEHSRKYKAPRNVMNSQTIENLRNTVRAELRLLPQRAAEPLPKIDRFVTSSSDIASLPNPERRNRLESTTTPSRIGHYDQREYIPTGKQNEMPRQISLSPRQQKTVESEPKDDIDLSAARREFEDDNSGTNSQELSFLKPIDNGTGTFSLFSPSPSPEAKKSGDNSGFLF